MKFSQLKWLYDEGLYTNEQFKVFVKARWITVEQFEEVTQTKYETKTPE